MGIEILIVDDHELFAEGLEILLSTVPDVSVAGSVATADDAVQRVKESRVDLVLMDVRLAGERNGIGATRDIKAIAPSVKVIVLTMFTDPATVAEAVRAGADGYMCKGTSPDTLVRAIRQVMRGHAVLDPQVTEGIFGQLGRNSRALTQRELQVLQSLAVGSSTRDVAGEIHVSEETVKSYLKQVFRKLHVHDRTEAVAESIRRGFIH